MADDPRKNLYINPKAANSLMAKNNRLRSKIESNKFNYLYQTKSNKNMSPSKTSLLSPYGNVGLKGGHNQMFKQTYQQHQHQQKQLQLNYQQNEKQNFYQDLTDDSAIGLSEKQPLIGDDPISSDSNLNYESSGAGSDFGSSSICDHNSKRSSNFKYTEFEEKKKKMLQSSEKRTTNLQTMMHIFKANIGTGILAMPNAFMNAGLFLGLAVLPMLCCFCTHSMHILIHANRIVSRRLQCGMLEYQELFPKAMQIGPKVLRPYAQWSATAVNTCLLLTQLGFCCVYSLFVAENISQFLSELTPLTLKPIHYLGLLLPLFILLSFVKSLSHLSLASSMANLLQSIGLLIVMFNLVQDLPSVTSVPSFGQVTKYPLFFGTAIYAFEGIGLILPLQKEMATPQSLTGYTGVLNSSMLIVALCNIAIGFFGYLKFGNNVAGSITLNLPAEPIYQSCKMIFAVAIFLSYAIQYYVPFYIIWQFIKNRFNLKEGTKFTTTLEYFSRSALVIFTIALAAAVPKLELFISLVGALSSSGLALIFPPLIDICVRWEEEQGFWRWTWIWSKNFAILILGLVGFATGTYASLENIVTNL